MLYFSFYQRYPLSDAVVIISSITGTGSLYLTPLIQDIHSGQASTRIN